MRPETRPIFYNESGRRARLTDGVLLLICGVATLGLAALVYGVVIAPHLPVFQAAGPQEARLDAALSRRHVITDPINPTSNRQVPASAAQALRLAHMAASDRAFAALKRRAGALDGIVPSWVDVQQEAGRIRLRVDDESPEVARWLRRNAPHLQVFPLLRSGLTRHETSVIFASAGLRDQVISEIASYLDRTGFAGITVQVPVTTPFNERVVVRFLRELKDRIARQQRKLIVLTSLTDRSARVGALSDVCDYVLVTTHDNVQYGKPAPIVPQGWLEAQLSALFGHVDPARIILSIGSFGFDWDASGGMKQVSVPAAWMSMRSGRAPLIFDTRSFNPSFRYRDEHDRTREVWLLDAITGFNQLRAILSYSPAGIVLWSLGFEDPGIWSMVARTKLPDASALRTLEVLQPGQDLFAPLKAALVAAAPGGPGRRTLAYNDRLGLIVAQTIERSPSQALVAASHPVASDLVALTFDDGPDPQVTPRILDILREKGAKATFYIVGRNAVQAPGLLKRIYDEGHDIGNHTFSHPLLMESGRERITLELNTTQRLIELQAGIRTSLFRPPGAYTSLSYLDTSPLLIEVPTDLGYQVGAIEIDSFDWMTGSLGTVRKDQIVDRVVDAVSRGRGQVVLMHDAGGNRRLTIEALPDIIDRLQAQGFRFVATHELVGKPRDAVMPPVQGSNITEAVSTEAWRLGLHTVSWSAEMLPTVAIVTTVLAIFRLTLILLGATAHRLRGGHRVAATEWQPAGIAVLVPAYNEEVVILKTVRTLLASTIVRQIEIIVIDDGSTDGTASVVREAFGDIAAVKVYSKPNGGKAAALNWGLQKTSAEIVVAIDGDTVLLPDAIEHLVRHFADARIGAVAGSVSVGNRTTLMTRFQALEYTLSQNLDRRAFELINAIGVVPGAIGAWRRTALLEVGGYSSDTLAEDADLTIALELAGWQVVCEPRARALTEAPERLRPFLKQRFRWMFGTLQVAYKHGAASLRRPRGISLVLVPNVLLFQFLFTLLAPVMDLILIYTAVTSIFEILMSGSKGQGDDTLELLAAYWLIFQLFDLLAGMAALLLHGRSTEWRLLPLLVLQRFSYRQLLYVTALRTLLTALRGTFVGWGKLVRTGSVDVPTASIPSR